MEPALKHFKEAFIKNQNLLFELLQSIIMKTKVYYDNKRKNKMLFEFKVFTS